MKKIFTLFAMGILCLCASKAAAQIGQNFEPVSGSDPLPALLANCWSFSGAGWDNTSKMTNTGSLVVIPTTSNSTNLTSNNARITTPYIDLQTGTIISLNYKLYNINNSNKNISNQATRTVALSLQNRDGVKTLLTSVTLDNSTRGNTIFPLSYKLLSNPGTQRLLIEVSGNGDGNAYMFLDDLLIANSGGVQPAFHYSPSNCNTPPVAGNNTYNAPTYSAAYTGTSVLDNDSDPNDESITITSYTQPVGGTVVMNTDGTFIYTPRTDTTVTFTSFTYTIRDDGYERLSTTATVYLYFPQVTTLPLHLLNFSGTAETKTSLAWSVASNEEGLYFEVQRSSNGSTYKAVAIVFTTEKAGHEQYRVNEAVVTSQTWYRLKIINRDGSVFFSNVISFNSAKTAASIILLQNPVQHTLRFSVPGATTISRIMVYNTAGMVVYAEKSSLQKGNNNISITLQPNLPAGIYVLHVITPSGSNTTRFVKQ
jgi:hypothetical protein